MEKDYLLTLAHAIYEDGLHSCGFPKHLCMDPENDGYFEIPDTLTVCNVDRLIELENRERNSNKNFVPEAGEILAVEYTRDTPLPPPKEITT